MEEGFGDRGDCSANPITAHYVTTDWDLQSVSWWQAETGKAWTPGGDFDPTVAATLGGLGPKSDGQWDVFTDNFNAMVQGWVNGTANYGMLLKFETEGSGPDLNFRWYNDRAGAAASPTLEVTYHLTPEPATMALLAVGGIGAMIRRRRMA
jgi:hypothetical protein